jgi:hypothetical protein
VRLTPPFSLLTFPCNAAEINSDFGSENAAIVLKSMKPVKKMFYLSFATANHPGIVARAIGCPVSIL